MNLTLEKTTGRLTPAGEVPALARAALAASIRLVTNNVAELLPGGHPLALKIYNPADTVNPIATFSVWTEVAAEKIYTAQLIPAAEPGLAWLKLPTLLARISYGTPNVDSQLFHVSFGGQGGAGTSLAPIIITQPAGPVKYNALVGTFGGRAAADQVEGAWKAPANCQLLGLQLTAQDAPTGAALLVDVLKGGVAQNKIATLAAGQKAQETIFGAPLAVAVGEVIAFKATQVGSTKPGTNLTVQAIVQLV